MDQAALAASPSPPAVHVSLLRFARWLGWAVIFVGLALLIAGRTDLPRLWLFLAVSLGMMLAGLFVVPEETMTSRLTGKHGTADPILLRLIRIVSMLQILVSLLDVGRLHLGDGVPLAVSLIASAVMATGFGVVLWAMRTNRYFMPQVRIQAERGHQLVDSGPYALVRHPGYVGMAMFAGTGGLTVGSWIGAAFGLMGAALFVYRAAAEDRFLHANLAGYGAFAARTRYRLIPGIW